jgi:hypothetical protein
LNPHEGSAASLFERQSFSDLVHFMYQRLRGRRLQLAAVRVVAASCAVLLLTGCTVFGITIGEEEEATATPRPTATRTPSARATSTPRANSSPTPRATSTPRATATPVSEVERQLLALDEQWAETESVHFTLDIDGATYLDANEQIELKGAEGDLARPESAKATATIQGGFIPFDVEIVTIGDDAWVTNFITGDWEAAPAGFDFNPALLFSETEGLSAVLLNDLREAELLGIENIDGRRARHITGLVSEDDIEDLVAGALLGDDIRVDVWMDEETDEVLRLRITEPETEDDPTAWIMNFSDHNEPVEIEAPDI